MGAEAATRHATYADLEAAPQHVVQWLLLATIGAGEEVRVAPFDAVGFPLDALFPFDAPASPDKPSDEA